MIDLGGACAEDASGRRGVVVGRDPAGGGQGAPDDLQTLDQLLGDQALLAPIAVRWERLLAEAGRRRGGVARRSRWRPTCG